MKGSSSETFLTRVAEPPPPAHPAHAAHPPPPQSLQEDFGLANGLNDLSNVVRLLTFLFFFTLLLLSSTYTSKCLMIRVAIVIEF